jgi:hypothetical protein
MQQQNTEQQMRLWSRVCVTDPRHVKPITGKQYNGNSPKPYWIVQRMTEVFGPCGLGWGFTILSERMERLSETDILHIAVVRLWFKLDGERGEFEQIGQTKAAYKTASGKILVDEDAPKKSVTDALVKCASYLGFAGDIFSGMWDDSKYVKWAREQWEDEGEPEPQGAKLPDNLRHTPTDEKLSIAPERETTLKLAASLAVAKFKKGDQLGAYEEISGITDADEKLYLWQVLKSESALRAFIKKHAQELREQESEPA